MSEKTSSLPLVGALLAGFGASLCCVGPLLLLFLGISGAWIGNLTALEPYRPLFILSALLFLGLAYRSIYLAGQGGGCEEDKVCAKPTTKRGYRLGFWLVAGTISLSVASPYIIPWLY